jgi:hypothetical protein
MIFGSVWCKSELLVGRASESHAKNAERRTNPLSSQKSRSYFVTNNKRFIHPQKTWHLGLRADPLVARGKHSTHKTS